MVSDGGDGRNTQLNSFTWQVRDWFLTNLGEPTEAQLRAWEHIAAGDDTLVCAPTGSGKTLAAFLWALNRLVGELSSGETLSGVDVLYVSPLKALNYDIERNLGLPIAGIAALDPTLAPITVGVRSGDTTPAQRQALIRKPPQILITTPESLYLLLTSKRARPTLSNVRTVILDEVHALMGSKRGVHLAVSVERLAALVARNRGPERGAGRPIQRIGLSATVEPVQGAALFVGGAHSRPAIVDSGRKRPIHLEVIGGPLAEPTQVWDEITAGLVEDVRGSRSTLIFVNNRRGAETLVDRINKAAESSAQEVDTDPDTPAASTELARAHHGSVSAQVRGELEEALKQGRLPCLVATGTLELGIDMGAIDLVCQVESPKSVARGLQRVGRSGHFIGARARGRIYPLHNLDLVETAALAELMMAGHVEALSTPRNCLDVLAQHIVSEVAVQNLSADELFEIVTRAECYRSLPRAAFDSVLAMVAGEVRDPDLSVGRPRLTWDRTTDELRGRLGAGHLAAVSGGTIPDRGLFPVFLLGTKVRLGELDEEFVFESKPGDTFLLGSSLWRIAEIGRDRISVTEATGAVGRMPFWRGEGLGRPRELGIAVGQLLAQLDSALGEESTPGVDLPPGELPPGDELARKLTTDCKLDPAAVKQLVDFVGEQRQRAVVPTDTRIVVEYFPDEIGDWRVVILSVFGARVNLAMGLALTALIRARLGLSIEWTYADNGIVLRFPDIETEPPGGLLRLLRPTGLRDLITSELAHSALFASRFRENAARSLILPRSRPGQRTPLWLQRLRAADLMAVAGRDPDFPVLVETYRECLEDVMDIASLEELIAGIHKGSLEVAQVHGASASPFASGLLWRFVFEYLYQGDAPKAEAQAASLSVNRDLLAAVIGDKGLRDLLEPAAIEEVSAQVSRTARGWQAQDPDSLADLLRRFGDLTTAELAERYEGDVSAALSALGSRVLQVSDRWVMADEADQFVSVRAAPAPGEPLDEAASQWLRRCALGRGIFTTEELASRYGLSVEATQAVLDFLRAEGILSRGEFTPNGTTQEWVGSDVLAKLHRRSLSILRHRAKPIDPARYASVLGRLHFGEDPRPAGAHGLEAVLG